MELEAIYENISHKNTFGSQTQSQKPTEAQNSRGSRCLVLITVLLGLMCVVLVVFIIMQHNKLSTERDVMKMSHMNRVKEYSDALNSLKMNYSHLTDERDQLQKNLSAMNEIKLQLEAELEKMNSSRGWFYISSDQKSWSDSRRFRRDRGGDLIIINTEEKQRYISSMVKDRVWIGLSDIEKEDNMMWVDNAPLNKKFWDQNEPNDDNGKEDYVELNPAKPAPNNWNDLPCSEMRKSVCEN